MGFPAAKCKGVPRLPRARLISARDALPSRTFSILSH